MAGKQKQGVEEDFGMRQDVAVYQALKGKLNGSVDILLFDKSN